MPGAPIELRPAYEVEDDTSKLRTVAVALSSCPCRKRGGVEDGMDEVPIDVTA